MMSNQAVTPLKQPQSLGSKIDEMFELRERKRELNSELKDIEAEMRALEQDIIAELDAQDLRFSGGTRARATISESEVPTVTDWDAFYQYVIENEAPYLFERRVAAAAWRELQQAGEAVPGTEPFTKRSLSLRKV